MVSGTVRQCVDVCRSCLLENMRSFTFRTFVLAGNLSLMALSSNGSTLTAVEICAGAGGQALGLHRAGFEHRLAIEIDEVAAETLRLNTNWEVAVGDVADSAVWVPSDYEGIDLLAGGVPCPPFSAAGKQLGTSDERDLFAWAVEQVEVVKPRALMLENVRGFSAPRFSAYRQRILDRLAELGYVGDWRLLRAADYGVPQLRPRFVLVALRPEDACYFYWPEVTLDRVTVGEVLRDDMASRGWKHADAWAAMASDIGPTLVGGSKKHGGADLGPTRAKQAWASLGVDGKGVADMAPGADAPHPSELLPRLTVDMVAKIQGWTERDNWVFAGRKTSQYRQIGNAFPPPVAEALGRSIAAALRHETEPSSNSALSANLHDPIYRTLADNEGFVSAEALLRVVHQHRLQSLEQRIAALSRDFELEVSEGSSGVEYKLGAFRGFVGQADHERHELFSAARRTIS